MPQPGELDFRALAAQAVKDGAEGERQVKVASAEAGVPAPSQEAVDSNFVESIEETIEPVEETVEETSVTEVPHTSQEEKEQKVFDIPDTALVKLKIDGEETTVSYKEYKDILRRNATITKREQNFAQSRREFDAQINQIAQQLEAREAAISAQLAQPKQDPVQQALLDLLQGKTPAKPKDPGEILTHGEVQAELRKMQDSFEAQRKADREALDQSLVLAAQNVRNESVQNKARQEFYGELDQLSVKDDYKVVTELVPHVRAHMLARIKELNPATKEEALEVAEDWLKERLDKYKTLTTAKEQKKQSTAAKNKMESNDGTSPTVKPVSREDKVKRYMGKNGKLDFKAMSADALAMANKMA